MQRQRPAANSILRWLNIGLCGLLLLINGDRESVAADADQVDYVRQIKPIFAKKCFACHGALQQKSGLRLDTVALIRKGGESGAGLVPGQPDDSLLMEILTGRDGRLMPPAGEGTALSADEVDLVKRWISQGARGPADEQPQVDPRQYWSYQRPQRPPIPSVKNSEWVLTPIDAFIAAEHDRRGLVPSPAADRSVWLRRVYLDLIGIPPTRAQLQAFLADHSPAAYENVVDDLLSRPQYGERWGRHWMDVWRYSDWYGSRGINEIRYSQRHIWRWRDWIVDSLNRDLGYDQMIVQMLAGDELAPANPDIVRATGFLGRNWYKFDRHVWMFDTVEHTSQAFLGLTLKCCRCHDHKFDPVSQTEYYRFKAFFEPHQVRTDAVSGDLGTEKDATLGQVLKTGLARVYDKDLDAKTYLFQRGDNRAPDEQHPLEPGVPQALGNTALTIQSVALPIDAFYPNLRPVVTDGLIADARQAMKQSAADLDQAREAVAAADQKLADFHKRAKSDPATDSRPRPIVFRDDFSQARPDVWKVQSGDWVYENGHLVEKAITSFATMAANVQLPTDITVRLKYRVLEPAGLRSIGFSFDYLDAGNSQDVYTHLNPESQGIQAFHRLAGQQHYPLTGLFKTTDVIRLGELLTVDLTIRGQNLTMSLNGGTKFEYRLPVPRRAGSFAIWTHDGSAEFHELEIRELLPDLSDLQRGLQIAQNAVAVAEQKQLIAAAELDALVARVEAERAKFTVPPPANASELALVASRNERQVAVAKAREALLVADQSLGLLRRALESKIPAAPVNGTAPAPMPPADLAAAEQKVAAARQALQTAEAAVAPSDSNYTALGPQYPTTSTGRRLALARWIADPQNPRTARVAVNHVWLRHFGQALVPSVANFGLNGDRPSHPELLDWLAVEMMEQGWQMKSLHRLMVLSNTYRQASSVSDATRPDQPIDPTNRYLWRMNVRRMEAEVVRDSVLSTAGSLDLQQGGPEIPESEGQTSLRRSLYFRSTPNEKMKFLEVFDLADPNACYRRRESVVPNQALALMNSALALDQARILAGQISQQVGPQADVATSTAFIEAAFEQILTQHPSPAEIAACLRFLQTNTELVQAVPTDLFPAGGQSRRAPSTVPHQRARENLIHVLLSHNLFVTIR